jgi:hypothetical protein
MSSHSFVLRKLHVAMAVGAVALCAALPAAHAAVVVVVPATPISITDSIDGIYFNVITGVTGATGASVPGWDINPYNNGTGLTFYGTASPYGVLATGTPGTSAETTALALGAPITAAGQYNQFQTRGTAFQTPGVRFMGFKFLNEGTGIANYGWLRVSSGANLTPDGGFPAFITAYGYDNAGASVLAGAGLAPVPEPSTWALFGVALAGAAGLRGWRGRRAA